MKRLAVATDLVEVALQHKLSGDEALEVVGSMDYRTHAAG